MLALERREAITERLVRSGRVIVHELASELGITQETVRRDLDALEEQGVARRVHGGAVSAARVSLAEASVLERTNANAGQKRRIAALAARRLVALGATSVLVDAGTTTTMFAEELAAVWPRGGKDRLLVASHAPAIAAALAEHPDIEVHLLGGRLRPVTGAAVGAQTILAIQAMRPDVVILGTNGVDATGFTTPDPEEAAVKHAMVASARRVACLADASKLDVSTFCRFAELDDVDALICDEAPPAPLAAALTNAGCEVHVA